MGVKHASCTCQRATEVMLPTVHWQLEFVYLEDIEIFLESPEAHIEQVVHVLTLIWNAGVIIKLRKRELFSNTISSFSNVIHPGQMADLQHIIDDIRDLKPPTVITELRSFLCLGNVFRPFVPNFSRNAARLNRQCHKDRPTRFEMPAEDELLSQQTLQQKLVMVPVLSFRRSTGT